MKAFQIKAKILAQARIKEDYWVCEFNAAQIAKTALPGQFINIRMSDKDEPLLRRPLSIHGIKGARVRIFYEVVGPATQLLAQKRAGETLDIIGPLGNGFTYPSSAKKTQAAILVCGGMGVAPLVFLAERLKGAKAMVLLGARTKEKLLCAKDFEHSGCRVKVSTDDGSAGFKGRVSELLKQDLKGASAIYACGPRPMLKAVARLATQHAIPAQLSLEEHMSCGIGACLGCVVETRDGLKRVCKEGPVFNAADLAW